MDQVKVGGFIAELRKEKGLTQKQLAEQIGVSDKTISKWECGNGLPEMSSIPVLCEALGINMNELLSGERLAEEVYSKKAEENMMTLMKETEEQKKKSKHSLLTLVLCLIGLILVLLLSVSFGMISEAEVLLVILDMPSFVFIVLPTLFILAGAGLLKAFFRAFTMMNKNNSYTVQQLEQANQALRLGAEALVVVGIFESLTLIIFLFGDYLHGMTVGELLANIAVALLSFLYGLLLYIVLLPVRSRIERKLQMGV